MQQEGQQARQEGPQAGGGGGKAGGGVSAALPLVAAVALTAEVRFEPVRVLGAGLAAHPQLAGLAHDALTVRAQVQVHVLPGAAAEAASMGRAQGPAALLCGRGNVQQVLAQRTLQVVIQPATAGLHGE